ncbi:MAG TPA: FAD-dependent oxidoreductase [Candidatus Udaeobacter sp.]|jgi:glycine/D-amino acid oxidase-like deaminating enzyme
MSRVVVVGAGINGVTTAIELKKRGHEVVLVDAGPLPHELAASTDISKAVRAAYGADEDYTALAEQSIRLWRQWNEEFGTKLYHQVGVMFVRRREMTPSDFEYESFKLLQKRGIKLMRMDAPQLWKRFPAWNPELYQDGVLEIEAGYAESGRVVATLIERAKSLGVQFTAGKFAALDESGGRVNGVAIEEQPRNRVIPSGVENGAAGEAATWTGRPEAERTGSERIKSRGDSVQVVSRGPSTSLGMTRIAADIVVMAVGAWTPYLLPFTKNFFRATGQPVFHLKPAETELFAPERFPVFGADITTTGYYGFPVNRDGVVKIANHGPGREMSPESPKRAVTSDDEINLRKFLAETFPALADAPIVHTRVCMYCDTHDGHFWIARDPEREGLVVAAGDNGHGFKFAPVLGEIIADATEGKDNPLLDKFRWRPEVRAGTGSDAARLRPKTSNAQRPTSNVEPSNG